MREFPSEGFFFLCDAGGKLVCGLWQEAGTGIGNGPCEEWEGADQGQTAKHMQGPFAVQVPKFAMAPVIGEVYQELLAAWQ